jgi:hypothetical protein
MLTCLRLELLELCIATRDRLISKVNKDHLVRNSLGTNSFAQALMASVDPGIGILNIGHYEFVYDEKAIFNSMPL